MAVRILLTGVNENTFTYIMRNRMILWK